MPALKHPVNARWPPIVFVVLCAAPLLVATIGPAPSGRGFWVEFGVALGFLALGMLGAQFVLTARFPNFSRSVGQDTLLRFHRASGIFAAALVFAHPKPHPFATRRPGTRPADRSVAPTARAGPRWHPGHGRSGIHAGGDRWPVNPPKRTRAREPVNPARAGPHARARDTQHTSPARGILTRVARRKGDRSARIDRRNAR